MTKVVLLIAALFGAWVAAGRPAAAAPLSAYGKLPSIETAIVSPSGHAVALIVTNGEQRTIVVKDLASGAITLRGFVGEVKVRSVQWAGDKHLVLVTSNTANNMLVQDGFREWYYGSVIDLAAKQLKPVMKTAGAAGMNAIFGYPIVRNYRGEPAVFVEGVVFSGGRGQLSLFRLDLSNGSNRLVETGSGDTVGWVIDSEGRLIGQEVFDRAKGAWSIRVRNEGRGGWKSVATEVAGIDRPYLIGLGRDNASIMYATPGGDAKWSWREVRTDGAAAGAPLPMPTAQGAIRAALDGRLIGQYALIGDESRYAFFDPADQRAWKAIEDSFGGQRLELQSWSSDRRKVVVVVDSATDGPRYALVDLGARTATWLGAAYADMSSGDIAARTPVRFRAADGLELTGYLTAPRDRPSKGLPLVVFPHGGPAARDTPGFDWWAQAMASRGYAVLQVNFRGSEGLGDALLQAGYGQWGRKMQTDLSDGVRYLAAQGTIDPKRVCIVGGSYGGYAALAGAALDAGVYRCAVSFAGLADLRRFVEWSRDQNGRGAYRYWNRFMGATDSRDAALVQISPAAQVHKVDIPILLIHGKDDTVVPLEQSQIMADALRRAGKPVELVVQPGADHWLSRGDTRLQTLSATVAFLEKHNPPK